MRGIGVDLVHIPRIQRLLSGNLRDKFLKRAFHTHEVEKWRHLPAERGAQYLAGRWGVKEAVLKALGVPRIPFPEIRVEGEGGTRYRVKVEGGAAECVARLNVREMYVSVAHDGEYAIAYVIAV